MVNIPMGIPPIGYLSWYLPCGSGAISYTDRAVNPIGYPGFLYDIEYVIQYI